MVLEWKTRSAYALTELVTFTITCLVLLATVVIALVILFMYFKKKPSFFTLLRPLFENVFTTAIDFTQAGPGKVKVVFLGYKEQDVFSGPKTKTLVRAWVHIYFTLLCSVTVLWFICVFSDAVLYRKTSTCLDLSVRDTDSTCFLLSTRNIPARVQEIIDDEGGDVVPCQKVQNYLLLANITYDLEVLCYQSQLNPLAAVGVAYGATKSIVFAIVTVLSIILSTSEKLRNRYSSRCFIYTAQAVQLALSFLIVIIIVAATSSLHESTGPRNTSFDYLRGERFYNYSVIGLVILTTIFTLGLFPWWAFKPLEKVKFLTKNDAQLREAIHNMLLHHKFSSSFGDLIEEVTDIGLNRLESFLEEDEKETTN